MFDAAAGLDGYLALGLGVVEMRDGLGQREESVNVGVERIREQALGDVECGCSILTHERDHSPLPLVYRSDVPLEYLFKISDRFAVPAICERRRVTAQLSEAYQILRQGTKASGWVDRVG